MNKLIVPAGNFHIDMKVVLVKKHFKSYDNYKILKKNILESSDFALAFLCVLNNLSIVMWGKKV